MKLTQSQGHRLICGVISALNATQRTQISVTQETIAEAVKNLDFTQFQTVLDEIEIAYGPSDVTAKMDNRQSVGVGMFPGFYNE